MPRRWRLADFKNESVAQHSSPVLLTAGWWLEPEADARARLKAVDFLLHSTD
jgi:hypothetical protein